MSPLESEKHVALYAVFVAGSEVSKYYAERLIEVRVVDHLRLPDTCSLRFKDELAEHIDDHPFQVGEELEIRLGALEDVSPRTLFKGKIVAVEPEFGDSGVRIGVRAYDRSHVLHRARHVRTFQNQTSSDIVTKLGREAGLQVETKPSGEPHQFISQDNETDWDFMWRLASPAGFEVVVDDTKLYFGPAAHTKTAVALEWRKSLRTFRPRVTAAQQAQEVTVRAFDVKTKSLISGSASRANGHTKTGNDRDEIAKALGDAKLLVSGSPVGTLAEADKLAQATLDRIADAALEADGVAVGNPDIVAGATLEITGLGKKFSGTYPVGSSTHVLGGPSGYETQFSTATGASRSLGNLVGAGGGGPNSFGADLVIGLVTNNNDPDGLGRVRVRFPALSDDNESAWARIASPSAGVERGLMMLPQPDEEVVVGFEHGDTRRPFVLGSLFNGKDTPGDKLAMKDGSFALLSDKNIEMTSKEHVNVTAGKDSVQKVGGKSSMAITGNLEVKGDKDVTIEAPMGTLTIKAKSIVIEGTMDVGVKGTQVAVDAKAKLDLSASGPASLKGAVVNLG